VITRGHLRTLALSLPEVVELDHHGMDSYRIRGRIFATVPDDHHVRVMVDETEIRAAVTEDPSTFEAVTWGGRLGCVAVDLRTVSSEHLHQLLTEAWLRKAPVRLARSFGERSAG
jgi:hypothetical protein